MTDVELQPQTNGIEANEEDDANKVRPADIEAVSSNFVHFFFFLSVDMRVTRWKSLMPDRNRKILHEQMMSLQVQRYTYM